MSASIAPGRKAFAAGRWDEAFTLLADAREAVDLEQLAVAAHLVGHDDVSDRAWEQAHRQWLHEGEPDRSARCAAWLALLLMIRGDGVRASGWFGRGERLAAADRPTVANGLLDIVRFLLAWQRDAFDEMAVIAARIEAVGAALGDADLLALGTLSRGEAAIAIGDLERGLRFLDEAMTAIAVGDVSAIPVGIVYCAVLEQCMEVLDIHRAAQWTAELQQWIDSQPGIVAFTGACAVHRCQVMRAEGRWRDAAVEAARACARFADPLRPAFALACYERGEGHRLRGDVTAADEAYRAAAEHGYEPTPGLALLRVAAGDVDSARAAIHRMLAEAGDRPGPVLVAAAVEIELVAGDVVAARRAADALAALTTRRAPAFVHALVDHADGAVAVAEGAPSRALPALRAARRRWRELAMPYHDARTAVQLALACRAVGDHDAARRELDGALATFRRLGADLDVEATIRLRATPGAPGGPLTARECEVLRLVAGGRTNREIAAALVISQHTVARHLQNVFAKLEVSTRAAATAHAYEHHLL